MGNILEEKQWIEGSLEECEKRILGLVYEAKTYELKNHQRNNRKIEITLETKVTFTSKGQRVICTLEEDEGKIAVKIRSELLLHMQKDRGENLRNIHQIVNTLKGKVLDQPELKKKEKKQKTRVWMTPEGQRECFIRIKASYIGGYDEMEKPLVGLLEVFTDGIGFSVVGPKFFIPMTKITEVTHCNIEELLENPKWSASYLKGGIPGMVKRTESFSKNKNIIVLRYQNEREEESHCLFTSNSQLAGVKNIEKIKGFVNKIKSI